MHTMSLDDYTIQRDINFDYCALHKVQHASDCDSANLTTKTDLDTDLTYRNFDSFGKPWQVRSKRMTYRIYGAKTKSNVKCGVKSV